MRFECAKLKYGFNFTHYSVIGTLFSSSTATLGPRASKVQFEARNLAVMRVLSSITTYVQKTFFSHPKTLKKI